MHKISLNVSDFKFSKSSFLNLLLLKAISSKTEFAWHGGRTLFLYNDIKM